MNPLNQAIFAPYRDSIAASQRPTVNITLLAAERIIKRVAKQSEWRALFTAMAEFQPQRKFDEANGVEMLWGDVGVCNFFIHPQDLAKRDFSKVLYNWDCH